MRLSRYIEPTVGKGSGDRVPGKAAGHLRVRKDIKVIIVIDEPMVECVSKNNPDEEKQLDAYDETRQFVSEPIFHTSVSGWH